MIEHLFIGNGRCLVAEGGNFCLPDCIREILTLRVISNVLIGRHETDPCLVGFDRAFARNLAAELRRLRDVSQDGYSASVRRAFGCLEEVAVDSGGAMAIPPLMLRYSGIEQSALVIGAGGTFEIWNPDIAMAFGDPNLRELAIYHRDQPLSGER